MNVETRLARLERENRNMKRALLAVGLAALAVVSIGSATPDEVPEVIEAREFRVVDKDGKLRADMNVLGFGYFDENGTPIAGIDNAGFVYANENGTLRARVSFAGIGFHDDNGEVRALMNADGFSSYDENGDMLWMRS